MLFWQKNCYLLLPSLEPGTPKLLQPFHRTSTADARARVSKCTYIPYTERLPLVEEFTPEESKECLYELVSEYLERENLQGLPTSQRSLMTWSSENSSLPSPSPSLAR